MRYKNRLIIIFLAASLAVPAIYFQIKASRYFADRWVYSHFFDSLRQITHSRKIDHIVFMMVDHYEPGSGSEAESTSREWLGNYSKQVEGLVDSYGNRFQYSWFYPYEHKSDEILASLAQYSANGYGEVELHWHHHHNSGAEFEKDLGRALEWFGSYGLLRTKNSNEYHFAFIHGNWALDNSGLEKHCGVNDEISILKRNGNYADFTFSTHSRSQPSYVNKIMRVIDDPEKPMSYSSGIESAFNVTNDDYLIVQGPSTFDFNRRQFEVGAFESDTAFEAGRIEQWVKNSTFVRGAENVGFVKIHTHGITASNNLFGDFGIRSMANELESYSREHNIKLHYVTVREAYNIVRSLEAGIIGDPEKSRDYVIKPPAVTFAGDAQLQAQ